MRKKFISSVIAVMLLAGCLGGCGNEIKENTDVFSELTTDGEDTTSDAQTVVTAPVPVIVEVGEDEKSYSEVKITPSEIKYTAFDETYQAEDGVLSGTATTSDSRKGFKEKGYVTGISSEGDWKLSFKVPATQFYNINLTMAADAEAKSGISINGVRMSEFRVSSEGRFEATAFRNIKLKEGENTISIVPGSGTFDLDQVRVTASEDISKMNLSVTGAQLSDNNAGYNARALYKYLCDNSGITIMLGQNDTAGTDYESELIHKVTGKYPAIRMGDLMYITDESHAAESSAEMDAALEWYKNGGIVSYMWNWTSPAKRSDPESVYAENSGFDIKNAVTDEDIANMDIEEIEELADYGEISQECLELVKDIDKASLALRKLTDEGAAVIWRPLQEASNGQFWWGTDKDAYLWLWKTMYIRMTEHNGLHDLIWVWSAQNTDWFVGGEFCDVLSADIYGSGKGGQVNTLLYLQGIAPGKPVAMSECDNLPQIQSLADERAMWSYIGQWGGAYLVSENGGLSQEFNTETDLITIYNNDMTITRDKLPDLKAAAEAIKKADEQPEEKEEDPEGDPVDNEEQENEDDVIYVE